jgi:UDP-N-acetylglucosamine--N-acetylmuramyl-(pentapeptide) pyrophosphoryl-undecaprenol N-acetylglucosamine transferase
LVKDENIAIHFMPVSGIRGKNLLTLFLAPIRICVSVWKALSVIRRTRASIIIGLGGFVSGPAGVAAKISGRYLVVHEQNAIPGTTNKMLSTISNLNLSAFPVTLKRVEVIGNPLRSSLDSIHKTQSVDIEKLNILVMGGSRGARALNMHLPSAIKEAGGYENIRIIHQCGAGRCDEALDSYKRAGLEAEIVEFIDDVDSKLQWANIIICRAGALTVSEISAVGLPSILVPYPYAIDDHQTANAMYLVNGGAAKVVQETEFESGALASTIREMFSSKQLIESMSLNAFKLGKRGVAKQFVDRCEQLVGANA